MEVLGTARAHDQAILALSQDQLDRAAEFFIHRVADKFYVLRVIDNMDGLLGSKLLPVTITVTATIEEEPE